MVHSWDNATDEGVLAVTCDLSRVGNAVIRREMTMYFGVPKGRNIRVRAPRSVIDAHAFGTSRASFAVDMHAGCHVAMYGTRVPGCSSHVTGHAAREESHLRARGSNTDAGATC